MTIVLAMFQHETNTLSWLPTPYGNFAGPSGAKEPASGDAAIDLWAGAGTAFSGMFAVALQFANKIDVPICAYRCSEEAEMLL